MVATARVAPEEQPQREPGVAKDDVMTPILVPDESGTWLHPRAHALARTQSARTHPPMRVRAPFAHSRARHRRAHARTRAHTLTGAANPAPGFSFGDGVATLIMLLLMPSILVAYMLGAILFAPGV